MGHPLKGPLSRDSIPRQEKILLFLVRVHSCSTTPDLRDTGFERAHYFNSNVSAISSPHQSQLKVDSMVILTTSSLNGAKSARMASAWLGQALMKDARVVLIENPHVVVV